METMTVQRTKTGKPYATENGGGASNTGRAQIVCGANGERITPLFVPKGYSNGDHAEFLVLKGMCIIRAGRSRNGEHAEVFRIKGIRKGTDTADLELVGEMENNDGNIPAEFSEAVAAALGKAHCYHCREPHYIA